MKQAITSVWQNWQVPRGSVTLCKASRLERLTDVHPAAGGGRVCPSGQ